jgi:hypothetical protein
VVVPDSGFLKLLTLLANVPEAEPFNQVLRSLIYRKVTDKNLVKSEFLKRKLKHAPAGLSHNTLTLITAAQPVSQLSLVVSQSSMTMHDADDAEYTAE